MKYRREIDGLRAVAVLPVILFHAGFQAFGGGFVGVDIFFVISGYLITTIIYDEIRGREFSLLRFYERRVRRIMPALMFVCVACIPFAWFWMLPDEFEGFAKSLVAVNLFVSNILFLRESGYFSAATELKPLLHTWSLAVEEQFYIIFPLLMILFGNFKRAVLLSLTAVLVVVSLAISEWGAHNYPSANFYLLPTRAWELGLGAILAIGGRSFVREESWVSQLAASIGLCMIVYSVFAFDRFTPIPGFWALLPVLGAGLILVFAGPGNFVGRMLGLKPVVGIGLVSYSAYLWHQPIFAFARIRLWDEIGVGAGLGLSGMALILAYLSWRFVEQPFRARLFIGRRTVFAATAACSVVLATLGTLAVYNIGSFERHKNQALVFDLERQLRPNHGLNRICNVTFKLVPECRTSDEPEIVVWGDSHAAHLVDGILASNPDARIIQMTKSRCAPIIGIAPYSPPKNNERRAISCLEFNRSVRNFVAGSKSLKFAVLASPFTIYLEGNPQVYQNGQIVDSDVDFIVEQFRRTLEWLVAHEITPVIFASPPRNGRNAALCIARNVWFEADRANCRISISDYRELAPNVLSFIDRIGEDYPVIALQDFLCRGYDDDCRVEEEGVFIYRDGAHLSHEGARYVGKKMNFYGLITGAHQEHELVRYPKSEK